MARYLMVALHIWWRLRRAEDRNALVALLRVAFQQGAYIGWRSWLRIGANLGLVRRMPDPSLALLEWTEIRPGLPGRYLYAPAGQRPMVVIVSRVSNSLVAPDRASRGAMWPLTTQAFDGYRWFGPIPDAPDYAELSEGGDPCVWAIEGLP